MKHLFTILIALVALSSFAQKALPTEVLKSIESRIANGYSSSIVIGIIDKDGPQYYLFGTKTAGGQPVNEHTIYEIGYRIFPKSSGRPSHFYNQGWEGGKFDFVSGWASDTGEEDQIMYCL